MHHIRLLILLCVLSLSAPLQGQQRLAGRNSNGSSGSDEKADAMTSAQRHQWDEAITKQTAWTVSPVLGTRTGAEIDTLMQNYSLSVAVPSLQWGYAAAITGNLGAEGQYMNYWQRPDESDFFFNNTLRPFIPRVSDVKFYNTHVPMTLVGYNTGGSKETLQDWLRLTFNGNITPDAQIGAWMSYLYSRGSYENQAAKHFNWGVNGSYLGERYQVMAMFNAHANTNKENGGISDRRYITDPAAVQGGVASFRPKDIPVNLNGAQNRVAGVQVWMNHRYRLGFHRASNDPKDSVEVFVPVTQFFWTFDFHSDNHRFDDRSKDVKDFWNETHFTDDGTRDFTRQWVISNSVGIQMLEGFSKWARFGLSAYARHEVNRYYQTPADTMAGVNTGIRPRATENSMFIGGRLAKDQGRIIRYSADAELSMAGVKAGDFDVRGDLLVRFRMLGDTVGVHAAGRINNVKPSFFLREYVSNHFIWHNNFGRTRHMRVSGDLDIPHTLTNLGAGIENVQHQIYFGADGMPVQHSGNVQVFWATLRQNFHLGPCHWDNVLTYQKSSNESVIPLPQFTVYSNLYFLFRIATLRAQIGVDCTYFTRYRGLGYQPATMSFTNSDEGEIGNFPLCNLYLNMKLSKVKFYVMYSHINQKLFSSKNYFSAINYPLNPARFLLGLCVDFAN